VVLQSLIVSFSKFLQGNIRRTPDAYLDELKDALVQRTGKVTSQATIWRVLRDSGFTMKKVWVLYHEFSFK